MDKPFRQFFLLLSKAFTARPRNILCASRHRLKELESTIEEPVKNAGCQDALSGSHRLWHPQVVLTAAVALIVLAVSGPVSAAVLTATGTSWKITPSNPGAVPWNTDPAFNDSGWQNATETSQQPTPPTVARAIWSSGGQFANEPVVWARHNFSVSGPLSSAELTYGCDDDCTIWVNGVQVVLDNNGAANGGSADVLAQLQQGNNLIAFTASDNVSFGLNHLAWIQIDGVLLSSGSTPVPTLSEWALLGLVLSLGIYGLVRLRRTS
jgi:hypothetical protein